MTRGLFILLIQVLVCVAVTSLGLWALLAPRRLQRLLNENYALLPIARDGWQLMPAILRLFGGFLIWYGSTLASGLREELLLLGRAFGLVSQ